MLLYSHKENKDKKVSGKQPPKPPTLKGLYDLREVCISNSASTMKFLGKSLLATSWHRHCLHYYPEFVKFHFHIQ